MARFARLGSCASPKRAYASRGERTRKTAVTVIIKKINNLNNNWVSRSGDFNENITADFL